MTISSETRNTYFNGNGSTKVFTFAWKAFATTDIKVILTSTAGVETELTLGSHYSVSLNGDQDNNPGGTVTMVTAPASGEQLAVLSNLTYTQGLDLQVGGGFYPSSVENAFDRLTILLQQLRKDMDRSMRVSEAEQTAQQLTSGAALRANKVLGFDSSGNLTALDAVPEGSVAVSTFMGTVLDDANAATARATLGVADPVTAASGISYNNSGTSLAATNVQAALTELDSDVQAAFAALGSAESVPAATLTSFTSTGTTSWTVPAGVNFALVEIIGGGGGGGSGAKLSTGTQGFGGGNGGGSGVVTKLWRVTEGQSYTVVVGAGGSGGAAQTVNDTSGNAGNAGGYSQFGGLRLSGASGGSGGTAGSYFALGSTAATYGAPGYGGMGGCYNSGVVAAQAGSSSVGGETSAVTVNGGSAGSGSGGGAGSNAATAFTWGGGGGGGGANGSGAGYSGGGGGTCGAGGGGGGVGKGGNSGAGGSGARGEVRVWYW